MPFILITSTLRNQHKKWHIFCFHLSYSFVIIMNLWFRTKQLMSNA